MQDKANVPVSDMGLVAGPRSVSGLDTPIPRFHSKMTCQGPSRAVNPVDGTMAGADQGGI